MDYFRLLLMNTYVHLLVIDIFPQCCGCYSDILIGKEKEEEKAEDISTMSHSNSGNCGDQRWR